ncbi:MAG: sensor histidine kinase [Planctomycetota bacterium]|jgi:signal transduction histidine kinase
MRINLKHIWQRLLELLRLSPLSLAEKCRLTFGAAVVFILALALLLPYIWMGQLTKKGLLDTGRARSQALLDRHFQLKGPTETALPALDKTGLVVDVNEPEMRWIRFAKEIEGSPVAGRIKAADGGPPGGFQEQLQQLTDEQQETIEYLKAEEDRNDYISFVKKDSVRHSNYIKIFRATESCITCHNPQGSASPFSKNELIGAVVIQSRGLGSEVAKTTLLNRVWIIVAGLIAGTGAIVVFYWITQRVILRPIRQLRALANNVTEGNLDIRSSIKTGDEYEKLANAFNNMLDGLLATQEKLRQANKQLDAKIAELSERNIDLFKANKVKGEFLANISHEFRTPLNAILGFAQVLRESADKWQIENRKSKIENRKRYAENIITSGNRLLNMVNDLLDLAKTQAGKMELHIEKTSVASLLKALVSSFSLLTKEKKIKVKLQVDSDLPPLITDTGKVQQILYNFLSNAVKFTPPQGRIEIRAERRPVGSKPPGALPENFGEIRRAGGRSKAAGRRPRQDEKMVRIAVADTGPGIAEADREKIFEKFRQVDGSITRESTGSGLGLTISTELAAMLAGSIGMESEYGKGSTFWLDIPITLTKENDQTNRVKAVSGK